MIFTAYVGSVATYPTREYFINRVTGNKFMALNVQFSDQIVSLAVWWFHGIMTWNQRATSCILL